MTGLGEPPPDTGCPPGSTVCDQIITGGWPDVVFLAVLLTVFAWCAAVVLVSLGRALVRRWRRR